MEIERERVWPVKWAGNTDFVELEGVASAVVQSVVDSVVDVAAVGSGGIGGRWCDGGRGLTAVRNPFRSSGGC